MSHISDRIRSTAADAGMSIEELAAAAGLRPGGADRLEEGVVTSLDLALLSEFTGMGVMWFLTGATPMDELLDFARRYDELSLDERAGANRAFSVLEPFLPPEIAQAVIREVAAAACRALAGSQRR